MKTVLQLLDIGSYSTDLSTGGLSYYKSVKDLVEKTFIIKMRYGILN